MKIMPPQSLKRMRAWILLIYFQTKVNAFLSFDRYCNRITTARSRCAPLPVPTCLYLTPVDDDDISQHETMASDLDGQDDKSSTSKATEKKTGYRRIEDWHEETVSKNPKQVLTRLQQEKAMWDKKFEDLGGDGI